MKTKYPAFSRSYEAALQSHLQQPPPDEDVDVARRLGIRAVKLGLSTQNLARVHEEALLQLVLPETPVRTKQRVIRRGVEFFVDASEPIEERRHGTRSAQVRLNAMVAMLTQRTNELAASNRKLTAEILERESVEKSLRASEQISSQLLEKSRRMQEELRLLSRRLLSVQEEERKRISRELHDVVAQALTGINLRLATLKSRTTASAKDLQEKIATTQLLVEKSVEIVHGFARSLRPTVLDDLGLVPALKSYFLAQREETGLAIHLTTFPAVEKLSSGVKTALYRIVQESLSNVARHAEATRVTVKISDRGSRIGMQIQDNGRGFQLDKLDTTAIGQLGLLGMKERAEMFEGTLKIQSAPGKGTTVRVEIPHEHVKKRSSKKSATTKKEHP